MGSPPDDSYDLKEDAPVPATRKVAPVPTPKPALNYRPGKDHRKSDPEDIKNFQMPIWLLGGGVLVETVAAFWRQPNFQAAVVYVAIDLILGTFIMLAGIMIAAKMRQIDLGKFWIAVFKLSAISVAPAAVGMLVAPALGFLPFLSIGLIGVSLGSLLTWVIEFILYFALLGVLFDLDESDTWYCVCTIFIVHVAVYFLFLWMGIKQ